ncbi:LacI family DNA-binding transcriptional regulator [Siculibacillus lacustris]|uniref:LacI family DNA-binding transcriptional regulator n=1 Tax=Siculibacillus lacustris TaxID=1549641 RepID=A0A4Q9VJ87_9HYPH|nr:LacI family DNA-binding transcriptional regulator [Siculibacillus lacustris]TBW34875.1 LacI family DNA-binding transcriptional regulator [Siculibacillus lacustris]
MSIGIKDVAKAAGVSAATVSRVLGSGSVSPDLRDKVEAAVRATGYRPNLSARRLRSQHSRTIGLIVSDIANPFFTELSRAVEMAAHQADLRVMLCNTDENPEREALYLEMMQEERITGLILAPTSVGAARIATMDFDFPVILIDRAGPLGAHDEVTIDNAESARLLVEHLVARGHRHIAGIFGNTSSTAAARHEGYVAAMAAHGLPPHAQFVAPTAEAAGAAFMRMVERSLRLDAVLASNGLILLGVVKASKAMGLEMPRDLSVVGFDNETWTDLVGAGITVIEQPVAEIGRTAMALLFERLACPHLPPRRVVLSGRLVERGMPRPA